MFVCKQHVDTNGSVHRLQREVACFIQYLEPTPIEIKLREYLVHRIREAVTTQWPDAEVIVFGSFSTQLYLPNSDIDIVVKFPPSSPVRLRRLASCLEQQDICREPQIIEHASVSCQIICIYTHSNTTHRFLLSNSKML